MSVYQRERMCLVHVSQHHSECVYRHVCVCACVCVRTHPSLRAQPAVLSVGGVGVLPQIAVFEAHHQTEQWRFLSTETAVMLEGVSCRAAWSWELVTDPT